MVDKDLNDLFLDTPAPADLRTARQGQLSTCPKKWPRGPFRLIIVTSMFNNYRPIAMVPAAVPIAIDTHIIAGAIPLNNGRFRARRGDHGHARATMR